MEQHAVPQEILSVEFKLFGNFMTLREFIFIAVSAAIAWFIYFLAQNGVFPGFLAYPLILIVGGGGIMMGLVPFQDKTLDQWIINYFNAIGRPTKRIWKKAGFDVTQNVPQTTQTPGQELTRKYHVITPPTTTIQNSTSNIKIQNEATTTEAETKFDASETAHLNQIEQTINDIEVKQSMPAQPIETSTTTPEPVTTPQTTVQPTPVQKTVQEPVQPKEEIPQAQPLMPPAEQPQPTSQPSPVTPTPIVAAAAQNIPPATYSEDPVAAQPQQAVRKVIEINDQNIGTLAVDVPGIDKKANTINIVVLDKDGKYVSKVVCLVKNDQGNPVRAAISNDFGQILNNTPLPDGQYKIQLTKQGLVFPEIIWQLNGKIYQPIVIKSL